MEEVHQQGLGELHFRLMEDIRSEREGIDKDLQKIIGDLGFYTQEILTNAQESVGLKETALSAACRIGKVSTVDQLLSLQAIPTLKVYRSLLTNEQPRSRCAIAFYLLKYTKPQLFVHIFWLACLFKDVQIAAMCLQTLNVDSNVPIILDTDVGFHETWKYPDSPLPIQYAAHQDHQEMVRLLEDFYDEDKHAANDLYVDYLLIAAYRRHRTLACQILQRRKAKVEQVALIYEIIGASDIIGNDSAVGKTLWKKAIALVESVGSHKSRGMTEIIRLEAPMQEYRTTEEIDAMRAKELRIQAISVLCKYLGRSCYFVDALLKRDYSKNISMFSLNVIYDTDHVTVSNLKRVELGLEQLALFKFPNPYLVVDCLKWCIKFTGQLRSLLDIKPLCINDLYRLRELIDFTTRILLSVENLEDNSVRPNHILNAELDHLFRKVVAVFQPLNEWCCLLDQLHNAKLSSPKTKKDIFKILNDAGADLTVTDASGNVVRDFAAQFFLPNNNFDFLRKERGDSPGVIREN